MPATSTGSEICIVRETPILFTPENVGRILDGYKTQTRRLKGLEALNRSHPDAYTLVDAVGDEWVVSGPVGDVRLRCPYGGPGDRLWVKESYYAESPTRILYRATDIEAPVSRWQNAMYMPRWASRLVLELTAVRLERLQAITPEDAKAEGDVERAGMPEYHEFGPQCHVRWYRGLWDQINAKKGLGWVKNPWVWVLVFMLVS